MTKVKKCKENQIMWNTNKSGGWEKFKDITDDNKDLKELLDDENMESPTVFNDNLEKIMNKVKFKSFGKVSFSNNLASDKPLNDLYKAREAIIKNKTDDDKIKEVENKISEHLIKSKELTMKES